MICRVSFGGMICLADTTYVFHVASHLTRRPYKESWKNLWDFNDLLIIRSFYMPWYSVGRRIFLGDSIYGMLLQAVFHHLFPCNSPWRSGLKQARKVDRDQGSRVVAGGQYVNFVRWLKEKMMYTVYTVCSYYPGGRYELWRVIFPRSKLRQVMVFRRSRPGDFVLSSKLIVGGSQDLRRESMTELGFSEGLIYVFFCIWRAICIPCNDLSISFLKCWHVWTTGRSGKKAASLERDMLLKDA